MDGENNGSKPYEQMDDLGGLPPLFLETPIYKCLKIEIQRFGLSRYLSKKNPMNKWMIWGVKPHIFGSTPLLHVDLLPVFFCLCDAQTFLIKATEVPSNCRSPRHPKNPREIWPYKVDPYLEDHPRTWICG